MPSSHDIATDIDQVKEQSQESIQEYNSYESLEDALDSYAQAQIEEGNEVDMSSQARAAGLAESETDRAAAISEANARQEIALTIQGLLESYGHQLHRGAGIDSDVRNTED